MTQLPRRQLQRGHLQTRALPLWQRPQKGSRLQRRCLLRRQVWCRLQWVRSPLQLQRTPPPLPISRQRLPVQAGGVRGRCSSGQMMDGKPAACRGCRCPSPILPARWC